MGKGKGFGKTILFGEHFVVYGLEGIPCALGQVTTALVTKIKEESGYELIDNRPATPGYKEEKAGEYTALITAILKHLEIPTKVKITLGGDLYAASGCGASAACAVAIVRALSEEFKLGLENEDVNKAAFVAETAGSGTPSGIDNTVATYGGFLVFQKSLTGGNNKIENLKIKKPIEIVLGNSGKTALTKEVVGDVKKLKDADPITMEKIFAEYSKTEQEALVAIKEGKLQILGQLMNNNQELLRKINVSGKELEDIISTARNAGAPGAKLTGTGRGGLVICLTPGKELQEKVSKAIEAKGYKTIKTVIG